MMTRRISQRLRATFRYAFLWLFLIAGLVAVSTVRAQTGTPLQYGDTVTGEISSASPISVHHFIGQQNDVIFATAITDSPSALLRLALMAPTLSQLALSDASSTAEIGYVLPQTGVYYLLVATVADISSTFTLTLTRLEDAAQAATTTPTPAPTEQPGDGTARDRTAELLVYLNADRCANGVNPVLFHPQVFDAAARHALDMAATQQNASALSPIGSDGSSPALRLAQAFYPGSFVTQAMSRNHVSTAEVYAYWTAQSSLLIGSAGSDVALALVGTGDARYWTLVMGQRIGASPITCEQWLTETYPTLTPTATPTETPVPTAPVLLQPQNGALLPYTGSLTLIWAPLPNTANYLIEREACDAAYIVCAPLVPVITDATTITIEDDDRRPARWRVRATYTDGSTSQFSEWRTFSFDLRPVLVQPQNGAVLPFTGSLTFAWEPVLNAASYLIEREACNADFATNCTPLVPVMAAVSSITIEHDNPRPTRWRVRTTFTDGTAGPFSEWRTFSFDLRPVLLLPEDGAVLPFTGSLTFAWEPVPNAVSYRIERELCSTAFTNCTPIVAVTTDQTVITIAQGSAFPTRWRVRATFTDGSAGAFSGWSTFSFEGPTATPTATPLAMPGGPLLTVTPTPFPTLPPQVMITLAPTATPTVSATPFPMAGVPVLPTATTGPIPTLPPQQGIIILAPTATATPLAMGGIQVPPSPTLPPLESPQWLEPVQETLFISESDNVVILRWSAVAGADSYRVREYDCRGVEPGTFCIVREQAILNSTEYALAICESVATDQLCDPFQDWSPIPGRPLEVSVRALRSTSSPPESSSPSETRYVIYQPTPTATPSVTATPLAVFDGPLLLTATASPTTTPFPMPGVPGLPTATTGPIPTLPPQQGIIIIAPTATPVDMQRVTDTPTPTPTTIPTDDPAGNLPPGDLLLELGLRVSSLSFDLVWPPAPVNYANIRAYVGDAALLAPGVTYALRLECALQTGDNVQWTVFGAPGTFPRTCSDVVMLPVTVNRTYWDMQVMLDNVQGAITKAFRLTAVPVDAVAPMLPPLDLVLSYALPVSTSGMVSFPQGMRDTQVTLLLPSRDPLPEPALFEVTVTCAGRGEPLRWNILNTLDIHQPESFDMGPHLCDTTVLFAYSQPDIRPYISIEYDWPPAQSSAIFTVIVRHVRAAPALTPTTTRAPERPTATFAPAEGPVAPPDRDHALVIRAGEAARFSDAISYPDGDTSDTITITVEGVPRGGQNYTLSLACSGAGEGFVRWLVRDLTPEQRCGEAVLVAFQPESNQRTVLVTLPRGADRSYVTYTLTLAPR